MAWVATHPAEHLDRGADGADRADRAGGRSRAGGRPRGERTRGTRRRSRGPTRWPPQRSCSFVAGSPCLVRSDRDVLGTVVGGELAAPQGERGRGERGERGDRLAGEEARRDAGAAAAAAAPTTTAAATPGARTGSAPRAAPAGRPGRRRTPRPAEAGRGRRASARPGRTAASPRRRRGSPVRPRTAAPHAVGPWTSTPFASAIPPSRSFSIPRGYRDLVDARPVLELIAAASTRRRPRPRRYRRPRRRGKDDAGPDDPRGAGRVAPTSSGTARGSRSSACPARSSTPLARGAAAAFASSTGRRREPRGRRTIGRGIVVVEGVCALHRMLRDAYAVRVWVEAPYELRLARGVARDGEEARHLDRGMDAVRGALRRARRPDPVGAT